MSNLNNSDDVAALSTMVVAPTKAECPGDL